MYDHLNDACKSDDRKLAGYIISNTATPKKLMICIIISSRSIPKASIFFSKKLKMDSSVLFSHLLYTYIGFAFLLGFTIC